MRIVSIDRLKEGDVLGQSLFNQKYELLLAAGYELNAEMIELIKARGYRFVYIADKATEDITPEEVISETVRRISSQKLAETFENVRKNLAFEKFAPEEITQRLEDHDKLRAKLNLPAIRRQVGEILNEIIENQVTVFTSFPIKSVSGIDYEHALDTTILCILLGQHFGFDYRELRTIGTSAMVHDVGKLVFPSFKDKVPGELSREEEQRLREHPVYSMLILRGSEPHAYIEHATVFQHHEQHDGSGYPQGLRGHQLAPRQGRINDSGFIHRHAEILGCANIYDNLISGYFDGVTHTPDQALMRIINGKAGSWNPYVIRALTKVVMCYPVGATVLIKNNKSKSYLGYTGVVAKANSHDQTKPTIIITHSPTGEPINPTVVNFQDERFMAIELLI